MFNKSLYLEFIAFILLLACLFSSCQSTPLETDKTGSINITDATEDTDATGVPDTTDTAADSATHDETTTSPAWVDIPGGRLILFENNTPYFSIMYGEKCSPLTLQCVDDLNAEIKKLTGKQFDLKTDNIKPGETLNEDDPLIMIGATAYKESADAMIGLEKNQYIIVSQGNHIVIVAENDSVLPYAIKRFISDCLSVTKDNSGNVILFVSDGIEYLSDPGECPMLAYLRTKDKFISTSEYLYTVAAPGNRINVTQGGYLDGNYFYQAFIKKDTASNEANNVVRIVKSDAKTGKIIKISGDLALNHANDITYNPKINALLVVHNNPNRSLVTLVDPDTLEVIRTVTLPLNIYCMTYNEERDMYVVGISGGQNFIFLDADFKVVGKVHVATTKTAGYTTQGASSDNDFIYFVLYNQNVITVYDWEGRFVTIIVLNVGNIEPENISVVNGEIYVVCHSGGAKVFKIIPKNTA